MSIVSPIVAIIVAFLLSHKATEDASKQIKAIYELLDVFIAAQNPGMMEVKRQYEEQLAQLDKQIANAKSDLETVHHPFFGRGGALIDDIEAIEDMAGRKEKYDNLLYKREEMVTSLNVIQTYIDKSISMLNHK